LQCFGDIAQAIGGNFEPYVVVVAGVLGQAAGITMPQDAPFEMYDYLISLREGIMDAWDGIIVAMKAGGKGTYCPKTLLCTVLNSLSCNDQGLCCEPCMASYSSG
jgi:hypothetical protein